MEGKAVQRAEAWKRSNKYILVFYILSHLCYRPELSRVLSDCCVKTGEGEIQLTAREFESISCFSKEIFNSLAIKLELCTFGLKENPLR